MLPSPGKELASLDFHNLIGGPLVAVVNAQAQAAMSSVNFIKAVGFKSPTTSPTSLQKKKTKRDEQETSEPIYVTFKYPHEIQPYQPAGVTITGFTVTPGTGYTALPTVSVAGGGGSGLAFTPTISGGGLVITLNSPGSGYTSAPIVTVTGGDGTGASAVVTTTVRHAEPSKYEVMSLQVPILTILPIPFIRVEEMTLDFNAKIDTVESMKIDQSLEYDESLEVGGGVSIEGIGSGTANFKASMSLKESYSYGNQVNRTYTMAIHVKAVQAEMPAGMDRILGILQSVIKPYAGSTPIPVT